MREGGEEGARGHFLPPSSDARIGPRRRRMSRRRAQRSEEPPIILALSRRFPPLRPRPVPPLPHGDAPLAWRLPRRHPPARPGPRRRRRRDARLIPLVYDRAAHARARAAAAARAAETVNTTALVHEAYEKLARAARRSRTASTSSASPRAPCARCWWTTPARQQAAKRGGGAPARSRSTRSSWRARDGRAAGGAGRGPDAARRRRPRQARSSSSATSSASRSPRRPRCSASRRRRSSATGPRRAPGSCSPSPRRRMADADRPDAPVDLFQRAARRPLRTTRRLASPVSRRRGRLRRPSRLLFPRAAARPRARPGPAGRRRPGPAPRSRCSRLHAASGPRRRVARDARPTTCSTRPTRLGQRSAVAARRLLGRGGMGGVYRAERADDTFQQRAALKLVRPRPGRRLPPALPPRARAAGRPRPPRHRAPARRRRRAGRRALPGDGAGRGRADHGLCDRARAGLRDRIALFLHACDAVAHAHPTSSSTATSSRRTSSSRTPTAGRA